MKYCKKFVKFCNDNEPCFSCMERTAYSDRMLRKHMTRIHLFDEFNENISHLDEHD